MIEILSGCWVYVAMIATAACIGWLVCRGVSAQRKAHREAAITDDISKNTSAQLGDLRRGLRRIADAPDPLGAFVDAISNMQERDRREKRER